MAQTGVIIGRRAGHSVPDEYPTLAITENPTAWGVAIPTPEGLQINSGDGMDAELFQNTMKEFADRDVWFYLCNAESAINIEDDVPPFNIIENEKEEPELVLFIKGEFPGYKRVDSTHPTAYHYVMDFIIPELQSMYELSGGDVAKVLAQIEKPVFKTKMLANAVGSAALTFLTRNGKSCTIVQGEGHSEYKWGWVSDNYGYAEAKADEPKKPRSVISGKSSVKQPNPASKPPTGVNVTPPVSAGATVVGNGFIGVRAEKPPPGLTRQEQKQFYKKRLGYPVEGFEKGVEINCYYDKRTNQTISMDQVRKMGMDAVSVPMLTGNPPRVGGKDVETDHIKDGGKPTGQAVPKDILPLLDQPAREYIEAKFKSDRIQKLIAESGDVVDPGNISDDEKHIGGISDQMGGKVKLMDMAKLPYEEYKTWMNENPKSFLVFVKSVVNTLLANETAKKAKPTGEEVHVTAKEILKPERRSIFPKRAAN